jgi:hypothetical protein
MAPADNAFAVVKARHDEDQDGRVWVRWRQCAPTTNLKDKSKLRRLDRILTGTPEANTDGARPGVPDDEVSF